MHSNNRDSFIPIWYLIKYFNFKKRFVIANTRVKSLIPAENEIIPGERRWEEHFCWTLAKSWGKIGKAKEGRKILFYRVEARIQQLWQVNVICSALKFRAQKKKLALIPRSNEYPPRWCSKSASHVQHCLYFFRFIFQPVGLEAPAFIPRSRFFPRDGCIIHLEWNDSSGRIRSNHTLTNSILAVTRCQRPNISPLIRFGDGSLLETLEKLTWGWSFGDFSLQRQVWRKGYCEILVQKNIYIVTNYLKNSIELY